MRYLLVFTALAAFMCGIQDVSAQEKRPLYNSQSGGGTALYNNTGGIRPLSLRQIVEGRDNVRGSSNLGGYQQSYTPYTTSNSFSSYQEIDAFRAQQAERARRNEEEAQQAYLAYMSEDQNQNREDKTQSYRSRFQGSGASAATMRRQQPAQRVLYKERQEKKIQRPERLFNSVR